MRKFAKLARSARSHIHKLLSMLVFCQYTIVYSAYGSNTTVLYQNSKIRKNNTNGLASMSVTMKLWIKYLIYPEEFIFHLYFTDIDECLASPCDSTNGGCKNSLGSFLCLCNYGWELDSDVITCIGL